MVNVGLKKFEIGTFNAVDGTTTGWTEIPVYKDTLKHTETAGNTTKHYQAGKTSPIKTHTEVGEESIAISIPMTDAATLLKVFGGTVTTVSSVDTWNKPKTFGAEVIKSVRYESLDGTKVLIPKASMVGVKNFDATETNIWLIDATFTPQDTGLPAVADVQITDPA